MRGNFYVKYGKRFFDFSASFFGLLFLLPVFLILSLIIKGYDGGPVFYKQVRMGRDFKPFKLIKFRTMIPDADKRGLHITSGKDHRITKVGRFLRKYKLDELPQLVNVLVGSMSLVGPRPEVPRYVEMFKKDYEEILKVKPGITDFATLRFRDEEEILKDFDDVEKAYVEEVLPRKIELYKKYVNEISFATDLKLILQTLWRIVSK